MYPDGWSPQANSQRLVRFDPWQDSLLSHDLYYQMLVHFEMLPRKREPNHGEKESNRSVCLFWCEHMKRKILAFYWKQWNMKWVKSERSSIRLYSETSVGFRDSADWAQWDRSMGMFLRSLRSVCEEVEELFQTPYFTVCMFALGNGGYFLMAQETLLVLLCVL